MSVFGRIRAAFTALTTRVDGDNRGWTSLNQRPQDRSSAEAQSLYLDTLDAWRNYGSARQATTIITDYVIGDGLTPTSADPTLHQFIQEFTAHPQNLLHTRLADWCDELTRTGNLFVTLHRAPDGMSYIRTIPTPGITDITTKTSDWETELYATDTNGKRWYTPNDGRSKNANAVILHFTINRPLGAKFGESDLTPALPWFERYERLLAERVRLNWAIRMFLFFVQVRADKVRETQARYAKPPEPGSIIVHDGSEQWDVKAPSLHANDARFDMEAVRRHTYAGVALPPHWMGEPGSNRAEAAMMQAPAERRLKRRQQMFAALIEQVIRTAYDRAAPIRNLPPLPHTPGLISIARPDISRADNLELAQAAHEIAQALKITASSLPPSKKLQELMVRLILRVAGEAPTDDLIQEIVNATDPPNPNTPTPDTPAPDSPAN